ncbi:N-acetylmuramoyl-L-alanine amidase, family 2 domain protein [Candidatus Magnetobacterium bavaricum]|uniref:N-acetylmuramoyl-L-alanine amidase, family 2 domain protein n=1 Tax=Candidatus Magnetobacterium bavaricum TaxID=29290 RepID=A0A0F3GHF2_9BACT|nr:N-acetylmuramoyl-L-alanine amidase, family 2 domain protein [Candidatus Magnetobacterium bavaricum]
MLLYEPAEVKHCLYLGIGVAHPEFGVDKRTVCCIAGSNVSGGNMNLPQMDKTKGLIAPYFKGKSSPNVYANRLREHLDYIIIHYTVDIRFKGVVDFFMTPEKTSAHFVVDRSGAIEQVVSLNMPPGMPVKAPGMATTD